MWEAETELANMVWSSQYEPSKRWRQGGGWRNGDGPQRAPNDRADQETLGLEAFGRAGQPGSIVEAHHLRRLRKGKRGAPNPSKLGTNTE